MGAEDTAHHQQGLWGGPVAPRWKEGVGEAELFSKCLPVRYPIDALADKGRGQGLSRGSPDARQSRTKPTC